MTSGGEAYEPVDADIVPLVRIAPAYPPTAARRHVTGWVLLEFTISESGTVRGARVIDSVPAGVFDETALTAIGGWKYQPKRVDGNPVSMRGIRKRFTFMLDD